mgnify:CR=1 FL=1
MQLLTSTSRLVPSVRWQYRDWFNGVVFPVDEWMRSMGASCYRMARFALRVPVLSLTAHCAMRNDSSRHDEWRARS